jgi:hypothetical protein
MPPTRRIVNSPAVGKVGRLAWHRPAMPAIRNVIRGWERQDDWGCLMDTCGGGPLSGRETVGHLRNLVLVASLVTATACHSWVSLPVVAGKLSPDAPSC